MRRFIIVLLIITCIEIGIYGYYNKLFSGLQTTHSVLVQTNTPVDNFKELVKEKVKMIAISDSQQYIAYVTENNQLNVVNLKTGQQVYSTTDNNPMLYLKWIRDDRLFVGLKTDSNELTLRTFQIGDQQERTIKTWTGVTSTSTFQGITYSPYTNDVYVLIGNANITKMYHFDTNGNTSNVPLMVNSAENPMMFSTENDLFYEDNNNNIYEMQNNNGTGIFRSNDKLLTVYNDTLYYGKLDSNGNVYEVCSYNNGQFKVIHNLSQAVNPSDILVKQDGSLIIISGNHYTDTHTNKTYNIPNNSSIEIENHKMFVLTNNGTYMVNE